MSDTGSEISEEIGYSIIYDEDSPSGEEKKEKYLVKDGRATAKFINGDIYHGNYINGKRHGYGEYTFADGSNYKGEWNNGLKHGKGIYKLNDGSIYSGEFINNQRNGIGSYTYKNGDKYEGEWKNNFKHGSGHYIYKSNNSQFSGIWSAGQLKSGQWINNNIINSNNTNHDKTTYFGQFRQNKPEGTGVFFLNNGNKQTGKYENKQFLLQSLTPINNNNNKNNTLLSTHSIITPPTPYIISCRAIDKSILKSDHFEEIYFKKKEIEGVPNFRRIQPIHLNIINKDEQPINSNIYCSGQPTGAGLKLLCEQIIENGFESIIKFNLRAEPIVYVNDQPFAPRSKHEINTNFNFLSLNTQELNDLESRLSNRLREEISANGSIFQFIKDTYAELENDRKNLNLEINVPNIDNIQPEHAIITQLQEESNIDINLVRITIDEEKSPSLTAFDSFVRNLLDIDINTTAIYCSDQVGKGRATTAAVIALLIQQSAIQEESEEDEQNKEQQETIQEQEQQDNHHNEQEENNNNNEEQEQEEEEEGEEEEEDDDEDETKAKSNKSNKNASKDNNNNSNNDINNNPISQDGEALESKYNSGNQISDGNKESTTEDDLEPEPEAEAEPINYKLGQYEVIQQLIKILPNGDKIKEQVDLSIDRASFMINLREVINYSKDQYDRELDPHKQIIWLESAKNYLERYFFLIVFYAYLKEQRNKQQHIQENNSNKNNEEDNEETKGFPVLFEDWVERNNAIFALLGTRSAGALKEFKWI